MFHTAAGGSAHCVVFEALADHAHALVPKPKREVQQVNVPAATTPNPGMGNYRWVTPTRLACN